MTRATSIALTVAVACALSGSGGAAVADDLAPPMGALEPRTDPDGVTSIGLPKEATLQDWKDDESGLGSFKLDIDRTSADPEITVYLFQRPAFSRAELAGTMGHGCRWGAVEPGTAVMKDGEYRDERVDRANSEVYRQRIVSVKNHVFFAVVQTKLGDADRLRAHVDAILASFKVVGAPRVRPLPAGYKSIASGAREIWTDGKKSETDRVSREWTTALELWPKTVPGKPLMTTPPRLILCAKDEDFDALYGTSGGSAAPPFATYVPSRRAVVVRLSKRTDEAVYEAVRRATGEQMMSYYYGGRTPTWFEQGMRMYFTIGSTANGHFDQPFRDVIEKTRKSVEARNTPFADILAMTAMPSAGRSDADRELYAWHWYFRYGPGAKPHGARYVKYAETIRTTGDVHEAAKAWDGIDHDALKADFPAWIARWRGGSSE